MKILSVAALSLMLVGCNAMEPSPVAPSVVIPAGPAVALAPIPSPSPTPFPPSPPPRELPPSPAPTPVSAFELSSALRLSGSGTYQEWGFSTSSSSDVTDFVWDFGDGAGAAGRRIEQHVYHGMANETKTYVVRVSARGASGEMTRERTIAVTFTS